MRPFESKSREFFPKPRQRALLSAALLALGPALPVLRAQTDPAAVRAFAQAGDPDALNALGNAYANGQGVAQDFAEAVRLYELAAARGHAPALFNLGMMSELGRGAPADLGAAFKRYLRAAELGFSAAQFNVGNMYANGIGVNRDFFEAALWFRQAADRGVPEAQYNLGLAYELGRGVGKDEAAAQKWYRAAADQGYPRARYNLALMLEDGRGSRADEATAAALYQAAAAQNFAPAQNNFGIMLAEGRGGLKADPVEAYAWIVLAVENGAKPAARDLLVRQLGPEQLASANARVAVLRSQVDPNAVPPPAAAAPVVVAAAPTKPDPQLAASLAALENARTENARLAGENARLAAATEAAQSARAALDKRLADATARADQTARALVAAEAEAKTASTRPVGPAPAALAALETKVAAAQLAANQAKTENTRLLEENTRLSTAAQNLQREKTAAAEHLAAARPVMPAAPDPAQRAQIEQLQRETATIRAEREDGRRQIAELAVQLKVARETPAPAAPGAPGAESPAVTATTENRLRTLTDDNARLNSEVKRSTTELSTLGRQLRVAQERLAKLGPAAAGAAGAEPVGADREAEAKLAALNATVEELRGANMKLAEENRRLGTKPVAGPDLAPQLAVAQEKVNQLAGEKGALERRLAEATAKPAGPTVDPAIAAQVKGELAETQQKLVSARRETEEIRLKLDEATDALAARTSRFNRELAAANAAAQPAGPDIAPQLAAARARVAQIESEKNALEQRLAVAAAKTMTPAVDPAALTQLKGDLAETRNNLVTARRETEEISLKLDEATGTLATRTARFNRDLDAAKSDAQKGAARGSELSAALAAAQADRAALAQVQKQLSEAEAAFGRQKAAAGELASAEADLAAARAETIRATRERAEVAAENRRLTAATQNQASDREMLGQLNTQLESAGKTISDLNAKNDELAKDFEVSKQALAAALAAQAAAAKAAPAGVAMRLEMQTLQDQVTKLETSLEAERGTAAKEFASLATQLQSARETSRALSEANRALNAAKGSDDTGLRAERDQFEIKVRELTSTSARLAEDKAAAERAVAEVRKNAAATAQERDTFRGQVDDMFAKLTESERRLVQTKQTSDSGRTQLQAVQAEAEQARTALAAAQAKLVETDKAVDQQNTSVAELTGLNDRLTRERTALGTQLTAAQAAAERAKTEFTDLQARTETDAKATARQGAALATLRASEEQSGAKLAEITDQIAKLRAENTRLIQGGDDAAKLRAEATEFRRKLAESEQAGEQHASSVAELTGSNEKLTAERRDLAARVETLTADIAQQREQGARLAQSGQTADVARREAEQRAATLAPVAEQLTAAQRELTGLRSENGRLRDTASANDRERTARIAQLQQENAAIAARLRQAQGTLDQIASAARLINGTVGPPFGNVAPLTAQAGRPAASVPVLAQAERFHSVQEGDSLTRISARYFGTPNRWQEIYDTNRDVLRGENALRPGQRLRIP